MRRLILLGMFPLLVISCKKENPVYPFEQEEIPTEGLTAEQDSILATIPSVRLKSDEIVFEDGQTIEAFLRENFPNELRTWGMTKALRESSELSERFSPNGVEGVSAYKKFVSDLLSEGTRIAHDSLKRSAELPTLVGLTPMLRPEQWGYGYVFNTETTLATRKRHGSCHKLLFGIECSGLMTLMMSRANIPFDRRYVASEFGQAQFMNKLLNKSPLKDYEYTDVGRISPEKIKSGDLIYFKKRIPVKDKTGKIIRYDEGGVNHIGIAVQLGIPFANPGVHIIQSNGNPDDCEKYSKADRRGPRCIPINQFVTTPSFSAYGVLKLKPKKENPDLYGNWKVTGEFIRLQVGPEIHFFSEDWKHITVILSAPNLITVVDSNPDDPSTESGSFFINDDETEVTITGMEVYERDPCTLRFSFNGKNSITLRFRAAVPGTSYVQYSTVELERI